MTYCKHDSNLDYFAAECGTPQTVECVDCGTAFQRTKPHHVYRWADHAEGCRNRALPVLFCSCEKQKGAVCNDCGAEFPYDVAPADGFVEVTTEPEPELL